MRAPQLAYFSTRTVFTTTTDVAVEHPDGFMFLPEMLVVEVPLTGQPRVLLSGFRIGPGGELPVRIEWTGDDQLAADHKIARLQDAPAWVRETTADATGEGRICGAMTQANHAACGHTRIEDATGDDPQQAPCTSCLHQCVGPVAREHRHRCLCGAGWDMTETERDQTLHAPTFAQWRLEHAVQQVVETAGG